MYDDNVDTATAQPYMPLQSLYESDEAMTDGKGHGSCSVLAGRFIEDMREVGDDRFLTKHQLSGDLSEGRHSSKQGEVDASGEASLTLLSRLEFAQMGLPRHVANANNLPYAVRVNPHSPMWMGFADQQVNGSGPSAITTFQGNASLVSQKRIYYLTPK